MLARLMTLIRFFTALLLLYGGSKVNAQRYPAPVDSLLKLANNGSSPKGRAITQLKAVTTYSAYSVDSTIVLLDSLLKAFENKNLDFGIARAKSLKSWYISFQTRYEEGLILAHEAMDLQEKAGNDSVGLAYTYMRLGLLYSHFEKTEECDLYFDKAQKYFEDLQDTAGLDMILNNRGVTFTSIDAERAISYYKRSLALRKQMKDYDFWVAYSYFNIGLAYLDLTQLDSAKRYLYLAESTFKNEAKREVPAMVVLGLGQYHFEAKDYKLAKNYCVKALEVAKKRNHTEIIIESTHLLAETLNKLGKHEAAFAMLTTFQELKSDFDSLNNADHVAELELKYNTAKKEKQIAQLEADNSIHESALKQARWIALLVTVTALLIVLFAVFFFVRRQQKQKLHASRLEAGLVEIRLVALRAQMNPHFIFNCINTAQNFVINAEKEAAYDYLANFAKLLRLVLENSGKTFVSLEDELKQIRLYIELELIRFSEKFSYTISVDPKLENGVYEIPSMILQPFIENAILHGLMNKEDATQGKLFVELKLKGDSIQCTITDNGVGRLKAQEIKIQKSLHYQSTALQNIEERLAILNRVGQSKISYRIEDILDSWETGTRVIIELPIK